MSRAPKVDGAARVREAQVADRVQRAQPRELAEGWRRTAKNWAREQQLPVERVLDTFDELASLRLYDGYSWDGAQARAWQDVVDLFAKRARDAA